MARSKSIRNVVIALVVLAGFAFVFMRSVRNARSAPYTTAPGSLRNWTLAIESAAGPTAPLLVLRPPSELVMGLFRQVFTRTMESLSVPTPSGMPLLLREEFDRTFAGQMTPEAIADAARQAGVESAPLEPRCLAYRRSSAPGVTRQLYFVLFDAPAFERFRRQIAERRAGGNATGSAFDPAALSPVLLIAESAPTPSGWLPLRANADADCVAPIAAS